MLTILPPKVVTAFNERLHEQFGCGFRWVSTTAPKWEWQGRGDDRKLVEVPAQDHYLLHPVPYPDLSKPGGPIHDRWWESLSDWNKVRVLLIDYLPEHFPVGAPDESQLTPVVEGKAGTTMPEHMTCRLTLPRYVGPFAPGDLMEYITSSFSGPNAFVPYDSSPNVICIRYCFGERVLVPTWKVQGRPCYFLTSYRRPSGIGGYAVMKEVSRWVWEGSDPIRRFYVDVEGKQRHYVVSYVNKLEKFYPEEGQ